MTQLDGSDALNKLIIQPEDEAHIVVVTRAPGFGPEEQKRIGIGITSVMSVMLGGFGTVQVEFLVQMDELAEEEE
jgi:hypothetical protein